MTGPRHVDGITRLHTDDIDAWFTDLYELYRTRWHPAIAAVEAQLEAERQTRWVLP